MLTFTLCLCTTLVSFANSSLLTPHSYLFSPQHQHPDNIRHCHKSIENIRDASLEELTQTESMNAGSAQKVYEFFHTPEENRQMDQRKNEAEET